MIWVIVLLLGIGSTPIAFADQSWISNVEGYWFAGEITNKEYVSFSKYIITNGIVSESYYEHLNNKKGIITYHNYDVPERLVSEAINSWEQLNPELLFVEYDLNPRLSIEEMKYNPFITMNEGTQITGYETDGIVYVSLEFDETEIVNTVMHEIGHMLDMEHTNNPNHLMFGNDGIPLEQFKSYGYVIPSLK